MSDTAHSLPSGADPRVLLSHHLKALKQPTILREYDSARTDRLYLRCVRGGQNVRRA